jgi:hypothetical protein
MTDPRDGSRDQVADAFIERHEGRGARAYRTALELEPPAAERRYIQRRLAAGDPD